MEDFEKFYSLTYLALIQIKTTTKKKPPIKRGVKIIISISKLAVLSRLLYAKQNYVSISILVVYVARKKMQMPIYWTILTLLQL